MPRAARKPAPSAETLPVAKPLVTEVTPLSPPAVHPSMQTHMHTHPPVLGMPMSRVGHMQNLCAQLMSRSLGNQVGAGNVLGSGGADVWKEVSEIQAAVMQRLQQQQNAWQQGLASVWQEYLQLRQVNTLSKLVEQEYNVGMQLNALCITQAVNLTALMENIQIDMGYWLAQKQAPNA
jgi:hypothetical protein